MNKKILILSLIFLVLIFVLIHRLFLKYVYVSPEVNISALKKITPSIKLVDNHLDTIMYLCRKEFKDMKYTYKNYYGSGFLKENDIPNDLDISVGIDLGMYEYDENNKEAIINSLENKISSWHTFAFTFFVIDKGKKYVLDNSLINVISAITGKRAETLNNLSNGIDSVSNKKIQVIHRQKPFNGLNIDYTFVLKDNEILINDMPSLFMFTKGIVYNNSMRDFPREVTIIPDFFVTIKNKKTGKIESIELIEESFMGQRLQISRRFFVPQVFTGNDSLQYLKKLDYLSEDEKFVETRMFNYFRYLDNVQEYLDVSIDPVKLLKRLHQCTDIISPVLNEEHKQKIYSNIADVLKNEDVIAANDYLTSIKNLKKFFSNRYIFNETNTSGYLAETLDTANISLLKLSQNDKYKKETDLLAKYNYQIMMMVKGLNSNEKFEELYNYLTDNFVDICVPLAEIVNKNIKNRTEFVEDFRILQKIVSDAGFHKIKMYYSDKDLMFIAKDDFTAKLTAKDIEVIVKENNLPKFRYKIVDTNTIKRTNLEETCYVRFKTTKSENEYWENLQQILLKDKKNFKIKRKYLF